MNFFQQNLDLICHLKKTRWPKAGGGPMPGTLPYPGISGGH